MSEQYARRVKAQQKLVLRKQRTDAKADRVAAKAARALRKSDAAESGQPRFGSLPYEDIAQIQKECGFRSYGQAASLDRQLAAQQRREDFVQLAQEYVEQLPEPSAHQPLTVVVDCENLLAGRHRQSWTKEPVELLAALSEFRAGVGFAADDRLVLVLPAPLGRKTGKKSVQLPTGAAGVSLAFVGLTDAVERAVAAGNCAVAVTSDRSEAVQQVRLGAAVMRSNRLVALVTEATGDVHNIRHAKKAKQGGALLQARAGVRPDVT